MGNSTNEKVMNVLSYIGFLFVIGLITNGNNPVVRYHANQGLLLFIAGIIGNVVMKVVACLPFLGWIGSIGVGAVSICSLALTVIGVVHAANGEQKPLPVIGRFSLIG
ncbi:MAG: DUF4870 domain-containing protein [Oscillospiraceae bacterium]